MQLDPKQIIDHYTELGYPPHVIAGIVGNLHQESSLDTEAVNPKSGAFGIAQWLGPRKQKLFQYAEAVGSTPDDPKVQLDFIDQELNSTESIAKKKLEQAKNAAEAADHFSNHFERAGKDERNNPNRIDVANKVMNFILPTANASEDDGWEPVPTTNSDDGWEPVPEAPKVVADTSTAQPKQNETSALQAAANGAADWGLGGFSDEIAGGLGALVSRFDPSLNDKPISEVYRGIRDSARGISDKAWEEHPVAYGSGAAVGTVASPINKALAPLGIIKGGAAGGALFGAGNASELSDVPVDVANGAIIGGTTGGVLKGVGKGLQAVLQGSNKSLPAQQEIMNLCKTLGVDVAPVDVRGMIKAGRQGENVIGGGYDTLRAKQEKQLQSAANKFVKSTGNWGFGSKVNVDDPGEVIANQLADNLKTRKINVGKAFDQVDELIDAKHQVGIPVENVKLGQTAKALDDMNQRFGTPFNRLEDELLSKRLSAMQGNAGNELSFNEARLLREQLGDYINRAYKSAGAVGNNQTNALSKIRSAVDSDLNNWAVNNQHQDINQLYQTARQKYVDEIAPFKNNKVIKKIIEPTADSDTFVKSLLQKDRPKLVNAYNDVARDTVSTKLTPGQRALKNGFLKSAYDNSINGEHFNASSFVNQINRLGKTKNALFTKDELQTFEGFEKLVKAIPRASDHWVNPNNGQLANQVIMRGGEIGALLHSPHAAIPAWLAIRAFSTPSMNKLLTRAGAAESITPEMAKQFTSNLSMLVGKGANKESKK